MPTYYNEIDAFAAAWLRELIREGLIADGEVDERSIRDVQPSDLRGFTQCHFFAGIGVWSYALRLAGWPDERPVWTGSCPCQPFSAAGKQAGGSDTRHLWPDWARLICECRPSVVFGEQVANAIAHGWFDLVSDDLEAEGYAVGAVSFPACSVGAPHIRQRLYFVADCNSGECGDGELADSKQQQYGSGDTGSQGRIESTNGGSLGNTFQPRLEGHSEDGDGGSEPGRQYTGTSGPVAATGAWNRIYWLPCKDGKFRPVPLEPAFFPLVDGPTAGRVGLLRGAGNAIVAQQAQAFIEAYLT